MDAPQPHDAAGSHSDTTPARAKPPARPESLSPLDQAFQRLILPVRKSLARIEAHLKAAAAESTPEPVPLHEPAVPILEDVTVGPEPWEEIILGGELCGDVSLDAVRAEFLDEVVSGVLAARALAGQLLLLQATEEAELPEQFRYVGEAYYRWRPRLTTDEDPLERSLADWLTHRAEAAGLQNSIELVSPGDRFDSTRHSATTRGVEVVAVHGWVVLRDNQKVYTKASVSVR